MRKLLVCLLAAAALGPAGPAGADPYTFTHAGRCELTFPSSIGQGYMYAAVVVYARPVKPNPVSADVTCSIRVGSEVRWSRTSSGTTVVEQAGPVSFPASFPADQVFTICTEVVFTSAVAPTETECYDLTRQVVTQPVTDLTASAVDPLVCPVLAAQPGTYGVVTITEEGDVRVGVRKVYDCPPYDPPL